MIKNKTQTAVTALIPLVALIAFKDPKSFTKLVVGIVVIFTLVKLSDGCMLGRPEHFKSLTKTDHSSAIADHVRATDITLSGITLKS